jgi:murein DD-endopeptidase MepM/ murein hydrolase activator NlpD
MRIFALAAPFAVILFSGLMLLLAGCGMRSSSPVDAPVPPATPVSPSPAVESPTVTTPEVLPSKTIALTATSTAASTERPTSTPTPIRLPTTPEDPCLARASFGDPAASLYILPYQVGKSYRISQSYCNRWGSHSNQLAYDFDIPIGADIIAARAGFVVLLWEGTPDTGASVYGVENNYLFVLHSDGTVAMYAHLKQDGIDVEVGEYVEQGQRVADAGNSGTGGTPHLHFGVYASWPNRHGFDVPVNFSNAEGELDARGGLKSGRRYKALAY